MATGALLLLRTPQEKPVVMATEMGSDAHGLAWFGLEMIREERIIGPW